MHWHFGCIDLQLEMVLEPIHEFEFALRVLFYTPSCATILRYVVWAHLHSSIFIITTLQEVEEVGGWKEARMKL